MGMPNERLVIFAADHAVKYLGVGFAALLILGLIFALRIAVISYLGERSDFRRWPSTEISKHPERTGINSLHEVSFEGSDGLLLAGWAVPSRNRAAIVLVHGTNTDRSSLLDEVRILSDAGFGILALDLPGQGASAGNTLWGVRERQSISAAVDWLRSRPDVDPERIGGLGASMGGYILIQAASTDARIRAVVLLAAPADVAEQTRYASNRWGLLSELPAYWALLASGMPVRDMLPKEVIRNIAPRAVFILGGTLDEVVPEYMARQLYGSAAEPKELWIVSGAHHADFSRVVPEQYRDRLIDFFTRKLLN
jgi:dipeptidyl aminopeptidase/acylaminoacyl peptidase